MKMVTCTNLASRVAVICNNVAFFDDIQRHSAAGAPELADELDAQAANVLHSSEMIAVVV